MATITGGVGPLVTSTVNATVTGASTVTALPSGTTTVAGTVTALPSGTTTVGGTVSLAGGAASITALPSGTTTVTGSVTVAGSITALPSGTTTVGGTVSVASAVTPYALPANMVRGFGQTTGTGAVTVLSAAGGGIKNYITDLEISNNGTVTTMLTFNDGSTLQIIAPAGSGAMKSFNVPLVTAANTALTFTPAAGSSSISVGVQGYTGA